MPRWDPDERSARRRPRLRALGGFGLIVAVAVAIAAVAILLSGALDEEPIDPSEISAAGRELESGDDPFAWREERSDDLESRATIGNSHVLYELSPGGVVASARRTARFRTEIELAAEKHGASAEMMEAMVLLESAGRPEVIAGGSDPVNAAGLAQILAGTATELLGMRVDLARSRELTDRINDSLAQAGRQRERAADLAERKGRGKGKPKARARKARRLLRRAERAERRAERARRERVRVDQRFDPVAALEGMGRYLAIATERFGREDLAVASYHMGIGNLSNVINAYVGAAAEGAGTGELVERHGLSYTRLFFDTSPTRNRGAWEVLSSFGDDSSTYYWRVLAARQIMRLHRDDRERLTELADLHLAKATAEEVFHPPAETRVFDDAGELRDGLDAGELVELPPGRTLGYRIDDQLGELSGELGVERDLYRTLRPEALATLIYLSGRVQAITGRRSQRLTVTSAVRDRAYQAALVGRNVQATRGYSLHTTGYSFDILREYASRRQARAFEFVLNRLKALAVIDWAREPNAIHITVSPLAEPLTG